MAIAARVTIRGEKALLARLRRMNPDQNRYLMSRMLLEMAFKVQRNAAEKQIIRGGGIKLLSGFGERKPHPTKLTSRTGTLRRSIAVDREGLPRSISVGSGLVYAAPHEFGIAPMPPRPFLAPALAEESLKFADIAKREIERADVAR